MAFAGRTFKTNVCTQPDDDPGIAAAGMRLAEREDIAQTDL